MLDLFTNDLGSNPEHQHALVFRFVTYFPPAWMVSALLPAPSIPSCDLQWPFEFGQIQTSVQAGGMTSDLIRARTSGSRTGEPDEST